MSVLSESQKDYTPQEFGDKLVRQVDEATRGASFEVRNLAALLAHTIGGLNERIRELEQVADKPGGTS